MKKFLLMLALIVPMFVFTGCGSEKDEPQEPLKVKFKESAIAINLGEISVLHIVVESGRIEMDNAVWSSSDNTVATVKNGIVTALTIGKANISLSFNNKIVATCEVTVSPIKVSAIVLNKHSVDMIIGETLELLATIEPVNATDKEVKWESSDNNVATVSKEGVVTATSIGSVTIKVIVPSANISDECEITVGPKKVTGIECQDNSIVLLGETVQINASVVPIDASNTSIEWRSLNPEIASVDNKGNVKGVSFGHTQIIANTIDGDFEGSCSVEVCEMDRYIKVRSSHGTEGSTSSGFYSYLRLNINTNSSQKIHINSIVLVDDNDYIKCIETPNISCVEYTNKYVTFYHGTSIGNTFIANGWKFIIDYEWNGKDYQYIYTRG